MQSLLKIHSRSCGIYEKRTKIMFQVDDLSTELKEARFSVEYDAGKRRREERTKGRVGGKTEGTKM